jgi:inorganic pyrophosphatase
LPNHVLLQVRRFFQDYKALEHKQVVVEDMLGPTDAFAIIQEALEFYKKLRRRELTK